MKDEKFEQLKKDLGTIKRLLVLNIFRKEERSIKEMVIGLYNSGFTPSEIAGLLNKPLANITSYISKERKKK